MLTELRIGNFKAFGETQRIPIKPLTLIFGANSSGKSSIIHSLLLAHHGLENGRLDAHQTILGGESVDLGGFRQYVHRHETGRKFSLYIEKPAPGHTTWDEPWDVPNRQAPWRAAFGAAEHVGVTFHIGQGARTEVGDNSSAQPAILGLEVLVNGRRLLEFERNEACAFVVKTVDLDHPYLEAVLRPLMAYSIEESLKIPQDFDMGRGGPSAEEKQKREMENQERIKSDPFLSRLALGKTDEQTAKAEMLLLKNALDTVLKEREYSLDGLVLKAIGPEVWTEYDGFENEDTIVFFERHGSYSAKWSAEAQAIRYYLNRLLSGRFRQIRDDLRKLSYLGPLRCVPSRHVTSVRDQDPNWQASGGAAWELARGDAKVVEAVNGWLGPDRLNTSCRLVRKLQVDAENLLEALREQPTPLDAGTSAYAAVNHLLQHKAELAAVVELLFEDVKCRTIVSHRDIGFGLSQVLPVLVSALASHEALLAIEQPELHLHPALQAELGDVFIESALGERKNTFLLETHSEHLILRILRRIRETAKGTQPKDLAPIRPSDVAVLYVEPSERGSIVREMEVNERGEFVKAWPGGFFEEGLRETLA